MKIRQQTEARINELGKRGQPFVFVIDFEQSEAHIFNPEDQSNLLWKTDSARNCSDQEINKRLEKWETCPPSFEHYQKGFNVVSQHIHAGDTYLLNYTQPTNVETNLSLEEIFHLSSAPYKVLLKNRFVSFSPETFVQINNGQIASFPMKGTMDASIPNSEHLILNDSKEVAEHHTIVDLIRNDLSLVSDKVQVEKFRYLQRIKTNHRDLWQVSSKITGDLPRDFHKNLGTILFTMLPAGSISGAPKKKTVEIIKATEKYNRGFYTGIFAYFDGQNLDSCVLIRYIENQNGQLVYKSGGGITFQSSAEKEYDELINKVYVPIAD